MKSVRKYMQYLAFYAMCFFSLPSVSTAQCVMCRTSVESHTSQEKEADAIVFNGAILYLLAVPYLSAALLAYMWYKKARKRRAGMTLRVGDKKVSI